MRRPHIIIFVLSPVDTHNSSCYSMYNHPQFGTDLYSFSADFTIQAPENWWGFDGTPGVNEYVNVTDSLAADPNTNTDCQRRKPRIVPDEAVEFHTYAEQFGLPMPFDVWPIDPIKVTEMQGYGPSRGAFVIQPPPYRKTHSIHTGLDFMAPEESDVVAVCDGIVIAGRSTSSFTGYGITLRCFADNLEDIDNDGQRNLSNIIVVYNHISSVRAYEPESLAVVYKGKILGELDIYYNSTLPLFCGGADCELKGSIYTLDNVNYAISCEGSDCKSNGDLLGGNKWCVKELDNIVNDCKVSNQGNDCVDIDPSPNNPNNTNNPNECSSVISHLHFETYITRGQTSTEPQNAIRINPILMFNGEIVERFNSLDFDYYDDSMRNDGVVLGLAAGDLNQYSQNLDLPDLSVGRNGFFKIQTPEPISIPEWWLAISDLQEEPQGYIGLPRMSPNLAEFLINYGNYPERIEYIGPNCTNIPSIIKYEFKQWLIAANNAL